MANQTVTTALNYDAASISGLLNGETITINGGSVTINADVRWNQQAAVFGGITLSSTLGGNLTIDGTTIWELPFSSSTGNVPTQAALGSNGVTGGTSGATGELTRVWATGSLTPAASGGAMPATGYVKLRTRTGNFQSGETVTLPGGATIVLSGAGKRSWLHVVGAASGVLTQTRLSTVTMQGDWYELGTTDGTDDQTIQLPVREEITAVQIETSAGSGVYEWWANGGDAFMSRWFSEDNQSLTNLTRTKYVTTGPSNYPGADRVRETTANNVHHISHSRNVATGSVTFSAIVKQETRQWCVVQVSTANDANRFGALVDLSAGTIIANPSVGSPTGTASAITSLGSGWYKVDATISHTSGSFNCYLATANSATPTYSGGLPTYTGTTTEGMFIGFMWFDHATLQVIPTDARGKFFFSDGVTGTLLFAKRTGVTAGAKPASGCKIRIPNIFLGTSNSADWSAAQLSWVNRYAYTMTNAVVSIDGVNCNWFAGAQGLDPAAAKIKNSTWTFWRVGGRALTVENVGMGLSYLQSDTLDLTTPVDMTITKSRFTARSGFHRITNGINVTLTDCRFEKVIQATALLTAKAANATALTMNLLGGAVTNCAFIGGQVSCTSSTNVNFTNMQYADNMIGDTVSTNAVSALAINGFNITVDGFSSFANLANVHPYNGIVQLTTPLTNTNINVSNIGSLASPWDAGSSNACGSILSTGSGTGFTVRRCFASNLRSAPISFSSGGADFRAFDVRASAAVTQGIDGRQNYFRGGFFTPSRSVLSSPGSHWIDAFTSSTAGAIVVYGNEPTVSTASQCATSFGVGSGFNGSGSAILSKTTDSIVWTAPAKLYGHTAFGSGGCSVTGTDLQNVLFEYQIDSGSYTFLCNTVRQSSGGSSGTNTVTVTAADRTALARQPQVGDFIQTASNRLPVGTTITAISTNTIICSNNFASTVSNNELITFSNANATVSPSNGYDLKIRATPFVASATTLFSNIQIGFATDATAIQNLHPLPGSLMNVTNLVPQSRVKVTRVDTGALLGQSASGIGTSVSFDFQYTGAVLVEARNASSTPAYIPWSTQVSISPSATTSVVALQQVD